MASNALALQGQEFHREAVSAPLDLRACLLDWRNSADSGTIECWQDLAAAASEPNPFFEHWYLLPSLAALDPENRVQLLVIEQDGQWIGLMPVSRSGRYYGRPIPHLQAWVHANCFLGAPLVRKGRERLFWTALLDWADQFSARSLFLHLPQVPLSGPLYEALIALPRKTALVQSEERAMLASDLSPEDYLAASLSGKKRKELRRQGNRLSEEGLICFYRRDDEEGLERWIDDFLALEMAGWKGKAGSALASSPQTAELFRQALRGAGAEGRLERLCISVDGSPIAMLANFLTPPGAFSYKTAFDENFARFSPGVLLQCENLVMLERPGIAWCDSCASADHPMIDHLWRERRAIGRLSVAIGGKLRRALFSALVTAELGRRPSGVKR